MAVRMELFNWQRIFLLVYMKSEHTQRDKTDENNSIFLYSA